VTPKPSSVLQIHHLDSENASEIRAHLLMSVCRGLFVWAG